MSEVVGVNCRCGAKLKVESRKAGSEVRCPQCGHRLTVPSPPPTARLSSVDRARDDEIRRLRRQARVGLLLGGLALPVAVWGAVRPITEDARPEIAPIVDEPMLPGVMSVEELHTRCLMVVDDSGQTRMGVRPTDEAVAIHLYDADGSDLLSLGGTEGGSILMLKDSGQIRVQLSASEAQAALIVNDQSGRARLLAGAMTDAEREEFVYLLLDERGKPQAVID